MDIGAEWSELAVQLRTHCLTFCESLHAHHSEEDEGLFPHLRARNDLSSPRCWTACVVSGAQRDGLTPGPLRTRRRRAGSYPHGVDSATTAGPDREPGPDRLVAADLGTELGHQATLVQFSSAFCAPCRATRLVLSGIAATEDGVAYVDIDAESHLDLVRRLDVVSTPTVFVLDPHGRIVIRAAGQPRRAQVTAALERLKRMEQSCSGG